MLKGKGFFIWKIRDCEGGDVEKIAFEAARAGLSHVLIKVADAGWSYNYDFDRKVDFVPPLVKALRQRGVSPWGWHFVWGENPVGEARKGVERVKTLGLDGYVIDAEGQYKNRYSAAKNYMTLLRRDLPKNVPVALSSFRYPKVHSSLPWRQFLDKCDFIMPQVYWQASHNPAEQLERCLDEFKEIAPNLPVVPTGAAYSEHGWTPTQPEITAFLDAVKRHKLAGVNFWEWAAAKEKRLWGVVSKYRFGHEPPAPVQPPPASPPVPEPPQAEPDIAEKLIAALNTRKPDEMIKFYAPESVHINKLGTVQGLQEILVYYARLFVQILPYGTFQLTGFSGTGNSRHITWQAVSSSGVVQNGNDTIGLLDGKIVYHYSYFVVMPHSTIAAGQRN